ncbi:hypothetical protein GZL_08254 [Streptomyces sp. 769]|nr:hypothetical protein GZL_08254 [Streptomyces sp. 769]
MSQACTLSQTVTPWPIGQALPLLSMLGRRCDASTAPHDPPDRTRRSAESTGGESRRIRLIGTFRRIGEFYTARCGRDAGVSGYRDVEM